MKSMKKSLLTVGLLALGYAGFAQFTPNRLVVAQFGDGGDALGSTTVPMFLKEYKTTGTDGSTYSLPMPIAAGTNNNFPLTGLASAQNEGLLTLSPNGQYLSLLGYGIAPGNIPASDAMRIIAWVKADGSMNTSTNVAGSANNLASPRCAITIDGTYFWAVGSGGGVRYKAFGYTSAGTGTTSISSTAGAMRSLAIFNGQLYGITNASAGPRIGTVGSGLPTTSTTTTALPGFSTAPTSPNQVAFLRLASGEGAPDVVYIANDETSEGTIQKWVLDNGTWVAKGSVTVSNGSTVRLNVKGVTAQINPATGTVYIYAVIPDKLLKITDANAASSTINNTDNAPETLATAPENTMFRGVALTPGSSTTLPVNLTSFQGHQQLQTVKLNWATASEQNNSHFNVLRANESKKFKAIGKVAGNGTTATAQKYAFTDNNPYGGNNYYQLEQVDFDGKAQKSEVVVVKTDIKDKTLSISTNGNELEATIYADGAGAGTFAVVNVSGQKVYESKLQLGNGYNQHRVNIAQLQSGVYIATVTINGKIHSQKFVR